MIQILYYWITNGDPVPILFDYFPELFKEKNPDFDKIHKNL